MLHSHPDSRLPLAAGMREDDTLAAVDELRKLLVASPFAYRRRATREVMVGDVGIGGANPLRVQSMTTTRTMDTAATVAQAIRLVEVGCEIVRITAPTVEDAANLREIRDRLRRQGIRVPLVADIHFNPRAALEAARWVEKVRINPGNYADSRVFARREYTDDEYARELERIEERLLPLVRHCKEYGVSMRIGTNHGSLSDRIMSRFGDTPEGMVESALEFVRICERHGYQDIVLSMKASNPKVMVQAYRLLAARMAAEGMSYPFHLGVTEAGNGVEARVKSAAGIGALLDDGLGDTLRVSLAEEPEAEIPVARALADLYAGPGAERLRRLAAAPAYAPVETRDPFAFERRMSRAVRIGPAVVGGMTPPRVLADATAALSDPTLLEQLFARGSGPRTWPDVLAVDVGDLDPDGLRDAVARLRRAVAALGAEVGLLASVSPSGVGRLGRAALEAADGLRLVFGSEDDDAPARVAGEIAAAARKALYLEAAGGRWDDLAQKMARLAVIAESVGARDLVLGVRLADPSESIRAVRHLAAELAALGRRHPIALVSAAGVGRIELPDGAGSLPLGVPIALASPLMDGIGDLVQVVPGEAIPTEPHAARLAFDCLQAASARSFKAEIVACPSCGRTLFDLQSTTERVKVVTGHLVGVKIAVMGCVVNGPGELADADFGYMGGAPGKVNLFVGKECVERNVPSADAPDRLVELIRSHGRWVDPAPAVDNLA